MKIPTSVLIAIFLLAVAVPAWAQPTGKVYRIGPLDPGSPDPARLEWWNAFRKRARELDYVEGTNIVFEPRWGYEKLEQVRSHAAELTSFRVDMIVTAGSGATMVAQQATSTIPIVMAAGPDPVGYGIIASLARPGGNVTGVTSFSSEPSGKRLELIRAVAPNASRITHLWADISPVAPLTVRETELAARSVGVALNSVAVRDPLALAGVFQTMHRERVGAVIIHTSALFFTHRKRLADLALKHRLPSVVGSREYVEAGGLLGYGTDFPNLFRRAADYMDKILKGAEAQRSPSRATDEVRIAHQPQDRKGARLDDLHRSWRRRTRSYGDRRVYAWDTPLPATATCSADFRVSRLHNESLQRTGSAGR